MMAGIVFNATRNYADRFNLLLHWIYTRGKFRLARVRSHIAALGVVVS
jgi:hypothetical protein